MCCVMGHLSGLFNHGLISNLLTTQIVRNQLHKETHQQCVSFKFHFKFYLLKFTFLTFHFHDSNSMIPIFQFRASNTCFQYVLPIRASNPVLQIPCFKSRASNMLQIPCFKSRASNPVLQIPCFKHASNNVLQIPCFKSRASNPVLQIPCFKSRASNPVLQILWSATRKTVRVYHARQTKGLLREIHKLVSVVHHGVSQLIQLSTAAYPSVLPLN
jgi:hypothetical protein